MCILELDHINWPEDLNTWAIIIKPGSFSSKTFNLSKKVKVRNFHLKNGGHMIKIAGEEMFKKLKICLKNCHDFFFYTWEVFEIFTK